MDCHTGAANKAKWSIVISAQQTAFLAAARTVCRFTFRLEKLQHDEVHMHCDM